MAYAIKRPDTAFSLDPSSGSKTKKPRRHEKDYLAWLHQFGCVVTGKMPVDAAHIRMASPVHGKGPTGAGEKPDDRWALPLHRSEHIRQHGMNEAQYWADRGLDPCEIASALHGAFHSDDDDAAELILNQARARAKP